MFVPYRKFAASPGWLTAGPLVHRRLDDAESHVGLDPRLYDAEQAGQPVVLGWFRYGDAGVGIVAHPEPGTPPDVSEWLDPLVQLVQWWADSEHVQLDAGWHPPPGWNPGE